MKYIDPLPLSLEWHLEMENISFTFDKIFEYLFAYFWLFHLATSET